MTILGGYTLYTECSLYNRLKSYLLYHAGLGAHDLDPVRVIGQLVRRVSEESVHDGRIQHEVRPEASRQCFHLHTYTTTASTTLKFISS